MTYRYTTSPYKWSITFLFVFLLSIIFEAGVYGQKVRFQNYSISEGLCHPFVYNINQDKNGFIWIGTGEGLCRYDGLDFVPATTLDSLPLDVVNVCYTDNLGKLWFGFNNGEIWSYDGNYFNQHPFTKKINTSIIAITQSIDQGIIVATQKDGIFKFDNEGNLIPFTTQFSDNLISALHISEKTVLVGTQEGLFLFNTDDREDKIEEIQELSYIKVQIIKDAYNGNSYWIGTEDEGLYLLTIDSASTSIKRIGEKLDLAYENVQDLMYDSDSNLIVCSFNSGYLRLFMDSKRPGYVRSVRRFNTTNGLSTNFVKCAFIDRERNTWLGTYGNGLSMLTNQSFGFYSYEEAGMKSIISVAINDSLLWMGGETGIVQVNKITGQSTRLRNTGLPADRVTSLYYQNGVLWVGTASSGIYRANVTKPRFKLFFRGDNSISNAINHITGDSDNIYAATKNGIFVISLNTGEQYHYSTLNGLPHNDIEYLYLDAENRLLFATRTNGIYEINVKGEVEEFFTVGKYELDFNSIVQDKSNNLWVSTYGQGIFLLMPDSVINLTVNSGLKSNYCYSLISDDSLYVWVGHRLGLSRIERSNLSVTVYDADNGIVSDCNQNSAVMGTDNVIYFGTTDGLITYDVEIGYKPKLEPLSNILKVTISDKEYDFREPINLPYDVYKVKIDYIGLNFADPEAVVYQYKMEGYDLAWSEITDLKTVIYPRIEDGEYTFLLRAIGPDGAVTQTPAQFNIKVKLPVWKTWWFITLLAIFVILVVVVIVKYREQKQKKIQEYLEKRLDERTREVVEQKEEIEVKNRDITDSINYAQRIQTSILPPIKRLQQYFDGSFIFYQPRDIVSGDFYWFDQVKEDKFIIVCADSTGHGVPGAFMSMIGTTLIKDVCMRSEVNSPSEIVSELDKELCNTLNQNVDAEQSNDGMDIIVCEIDTRTSYLRFCSAMRPMIVYRNGEQVYFKGSRSSVGGQYDKEQKNFKDEGVQLDKGDLIYMFSDGYPDQFGGAVGKKFKMVRLKNLLRDINSKPMEEQYEYVKSTFNLWREDFDQVDDVLFMGVKL